MYKWQMWSSCFRATLENVVMKTKISRAIGNKINNARVRRFMRVLLAALYSVIVFFRHGVRLGYKIFLKNKICIPYMEIVITTRCSLKCKDCANLMPYYEQPYNVDIGNIKEAISSLLQVVDEITVFRVIGGEPFVNNDLIEVVRSMIAESRILNIVIPTNGTVLHKEKELYEVLAHTKVSVSVSDYGIGKVDEFCSELERNCINFSRGKEMIWYDMGDLQCRNRTPKQLQGQFSNCIGTRCILNNKMYYCPRASHADDLGLVKCPEQDYVDLKTKDLVILKKNLLDILYRKQYTNMCNYCDMGLQDCTVIKAGVQRE